MQMKYEMYQLCCPMNTLSEVLNELFTLMLSDNSKNCIQEPAIKQNDDASFKNSPEERGIRIRIKKKKKRTVLGE